MTQLSLVVDLDRCMDTRACMNSCKQEYQAGVGTKRIQTYTVTTGDFPDSQTYFIPIMCQHCRKPACVPACPKEAIYKRDDGIVLIDKERCTDCAEKPCITNCPYNAIYFNEQEGVAEKCSLCAHLIDKNQIPVCVRNCNSNAYTFGDIDDPDSEISQKIKEAGNKVFKLKPEAGTEPSVSYILREKTWHDMKNLRVR